MAITTLDGLIAAMAASDAEQAVINKASIATQLAAGFSSLWRATGTPAQGSIPGAAAIPTKATTGALLNFTNPSGGETAYIALANATCANSGTTLYIYDRLAHMGGLSGTVTTAQTVGVDVTTLAGTRCRSDYADVEWWVEIYTDIGTTGATATFSYTNAAGSSGQSTTLTIGGASPANQDSRIFRITGSGGEYIESIETITHVTTGTAGSYGITARKLLATIPLPLANYANTAEWTKLGLPIVPADACLELVMQTGTTSTGALTGSVLLIKG